jgi:hypothetical protein
MTSKIVVNNIEADSGISTVAFNNQIRVGSATTIHSTGIDLGSGNITSHNINSTGIVTATSFVGPVTGDITGNITGDVTGNITGNITGNTSGTAGGLTGTPDINVQNITGVAATFTGNVSIAGTLTYEDVTNIDSIGIITAQSGIKASGDESTFNSNVGIQTNDITNSDLVGAGNSFVGLYIGDGFLAFSTSLNRPDGYYITTSINALNAGPVTLGSTMTLDGTWVIV